VAKQYQIQNYIKGEPEFFDTKAEASARIKELETQILTEQASRFSIIQTIQSAHGMLWIAPSENSEENGDYMVFISETGQYEKVKGRTAAFARNQELKDAFLAELAQEPVLAEAPVQPKTTGTQEL
jgi:hypothetical protein